MAKQIYIDENGNEQMVSGTINNASLLPISASDSTNTKDYIDSGLSGKADTSDITPTTISGIGYNATNVNSINVNCRKYGRLVVLDVASISLKTAIGTGGEEMLTGLPVPIDDSGRYTLFDGDSFTVRARVKISSTGQLLMWHNPSNLAVNTGLYGNILYFSAT